MGTAYPDFSIVRGTLQILEDEAAKTSIVLHWTSPHHVEAALALELGMQRGNGGYWIHTSGTDILLKPEILKGGRS